LIIKVGDHWYSQYVSFIQL